MIRTAPSDVFGVPKPTRKVQSYTTTSWADCVVDASAPIANREGLGLRFRGRCAGPEQVLVETFLKAATIRLLPERRLTVFVEPALDTGFPDLVAVVWRSDVARRWSATRAALRAIDLRLLHLLATKGAMDHAVLQQIFQRGLKSMLMRLEYAGVVSAKGSKWGALSTQRIFAVERIIAIEAKTSATQRVIEQASANTWFSSESHALIPGLSAVKRLIGPASSLGIGVLGFEHDQVAKVCNASVRRVPLSYGSWFFNEWTWRLAQQMSAL